MGHSRKAPPGWHEAEARSKAVRATMPVIPVIQTYSIWIQILTGDESKMVEFQIRARSQPEAIDIARRKIASQHGIKRVKIDRDRVRVRYIRPGFVEPPQDWESKLVRYDARAQKYGGRWVRLKIRGGTGGLSYLEWQKREWQRQRRVAERRKYEAIEKKRLEEAQYGNV